MEVIAEGESVSKGPQFSYKAGGETNTTGKAPNPIPMIIPNDAATSNSTWVP